MDNQVYLFLIFIINGILIAFLFDIFRILRKSFKTADIVTYIEDILFWIITGIITLYFIFYFNNGELRLYILLGIILGSLIYMLTISRFIIAISIKIISVLKNIIIRIFNIISYPLKFIFKLLRKLLFRPISFIFINIRKNILKFNHIFLKSIKKSDKTTKNVF